MELISFCPCCGSHKIIIEKKNDLYEVFCLDCKEKIVAVDKIKAIAAWNQRIEVLDMENQ